MHELSIARAIVAEIAESAVEHDVARVGSVTLRVGRLAGVVEGALRFGLEIAAEGSVLEGADLVVERVPVTVWCPAGDHPLELGDDAATTLRFYCDDHEAACPELLTGRELSIASYEPETERAR